MVDMSVPWRLFKRPGNLLRGTSLGRSAAAQGLLNRDDWICLVRYNSEGSGLRNASGTRVGKMGDAQGSYRQESALRRAG